MQEKDLFSLTTGSPDASDRLQGLLIKSLAPPLPGPPPHLSHVILMLQSLSGRISPEQSQFSRSSLLLAEVIRTRGNIGLSDQEPRNVRQCGMTRGEMS